jgi:hypothetical protein
MQQEKRVRGVTVASIPEETQVESLRVKLVPAAEREPDQLVHVVGQEHFLTIPAKTDRGQSLCDHLIMGLVEGPYFRFRAVQAGGEFRALPEGDCADLNAIWLGVEEERRESVANQGTAWHIPA